MAEFSLYLGAISWKWVALTIALDAVLALLDRFTAIEIPRRVFIGITGIGILVAGYGAWRDERTHHLRTQSTLKDTQGQLVAADQEIARLSSQQELNVLKAQIAELQKRLAPRRLTPEQKTLLIERLRGKDEGRVMRLATVADSTQEPANYAADFVEIFKAAKWRVKVEKFTFLPQLGLVIRSQPHDPVATFLRAQLRETGVEVQSLEDAQSSTIVVTVGAKPQ